MQLIRNSFRWTSNVRKWQAGVPKLHAATSDAVSRVQFVDCRIVNANARGALHVAAMQYTLSFAQEIYRTQPSSLGSHARRILYAARGAKLCLCKQLTFLSIYPGLPCFLEGKSACQPGCHSAGRTRIPEGEGRNPRAPTPSSTRAASAAAFQIPAQIARHTDGRKLTKNSSSSSGADVLTSVVVFVVAAVALRRVLALLARPTILALATVGDNDDCRIP